MISKVFLFIFSICIFSAVAQDDSINKIDAVVDSTLLEMETQLGDLGIIILEDSLMINRQNANVKFTSLLEEALQKPNAYSYPFDSLTTVSKLTSEDESFKIFTWQLFEKDDSYAYMGILLKSDGTMISFKDKSNEYFTPEFETGDADHWYGSLYYNMVSFQGADNITQYLLFGYDGNALMERRKVIEVMSFDESGNPKFGAPIFLASPESKGHPQSMSRVILEYFAGANVNCNYDEVQNQIMYEHLIFKRTAFGDFLIPDGSYEGYVFEEGKWRHNVKVFHQVLDEPPFPNPVLDGKDRKDIFGNTEDKRATMNPNRSEKKGEEARKHNKKLRAAKKKAAAAKKKAEAAKGKK